jgi:hypothetical protein
MVFLESLLSLGRLCIEPANRRSAYTSSLVSLEKSLTSRILPSNHSESYRYAEQKWRFSNPNALSSIPRPTTFRRTLTDIDDEKRADSRLQIAAVSSGTYILEFGKAGSGAGCVNKSLAEGQAWGISPAWYDSKYIRPDQEAKEPRPLSVYLLSRVWIQ